MRSVAAMTQLGIDNSNCLFGCEPITKKKQTHSIDELDL